jgi:hypothetical protein
MPKPQDAIEQNSFDNQKNRASDSQNEHGQIANRFSRRRGRAKNAEVLRLCQEQ